MRADCGWRRSAGPARLIAKYAGAVPRYTSYPTAAQFSTAINGDIYQDWLGAIPANARASLYVHVPFCKELCWYCGCHTAVARTHAPVSDYVEMLASEIRIIGKHIGRPVRISSLHFGGGSPNMLSPGNLETILGNLRRCFDFASDISIAAELDPRSLSENWIKSAVRLGLNRVSLGVQVFDRDVQAAVNRHQSFEMVRRTVETLRGEGVSAINFDLMYGLPRLTTARLLETIDLAAELDPQRVALFGYAHVPWMMARQRLIRDDELPGSFERLQQQLAAAGALKAAGLVQLGLDHFAQPDDSLAVAAAKGRMRRNFQGYTADHADYLIGFGASSISSLPQGFAQNASSVPSWRTAIGAGKSAVSRGVILSEDDRFRGAIIERLMCDLAIDLDDVCRQWSMQAGDLAWEWDRLGEMESDGLVVLRDHTITVTEPGRPFLRSICSVFDRYRAARTACAMPSRSSPPRAMTHAGVARQPRRPSRRVRRLQLRRHGP
jgi:oxygen-independent coproporphyrinogen III oxidase